MDMEFLKLYYVFTDLEVNKAKFTFATGAIDNPRDTITQSITGFHIIDLPLNNLGCPKFNGRPTTRLYVAIIEKIEKKLSGWKIRILSPATKLTLLKSILQSMPQYLLALIQSTKATLSSISKVMSDFFFILA